MRRKEFITTTSEQTRIELRVKTVTIGESTFVRIMDYEELETENLKLKKRLKKYETEDLKKHGKESRG